MREAWRNDEAVAGTAAGLGNPRHCSDRAAPAQACACGGVVDQPGGDTSVSSERAVVVWDGKQETIMLRLSTRSEAVNAGLLVPTPTPANVELGDEQVFTDLAGVDRAAHRGTLAPVRPAAALRRRRRRRDLGRRPGRCRRRGARHRRPRPAARDHAVGGRPRSARLLAPGQRLPDLGGPDEHGPALRRRGLELRRRPAQRRRPAARGRPAADHDELRQRRGRLSDADVVGRRGDPAADGLRAGRAPDATHRRGRLRVHASRHRLRRPRLARRGRLCDAQGVAGHDAVPDRHLAVAPRPQPDRHRLHLRASA